jgi:hypothetical protein
MLVLFVYMLSDTVSIENVLGSNERGEWLWTGIGSGRGLFLPITLPKPLKFNAPYFPYFPEVHIVTQRAQHNQLHGAGSSFVSWWLNGQKFPCCYKPCSKQTGIGINPDQLKPVHTFKPTVPKVSFSIIFPTTPRSLKYSLPLRFPDQNYVRTYNFRRTRTGIWSVP